MTVPEDEETAPIAGTEARREPMPAPRQRSETDRQPEDRPDAEGPRRGFRDWAAI